MHPAAETWCSRVSSDAPPVVATTPSRRGSPERSTGMSTTDDGPDLLGAADVAMYRDKPLPG